MHLFWAGLRLSKRCGKGARILTTFELINSGGLAIQWVYLRID